MEAGVVIAGGGLAGAQVALQLRQNRFAGPITLLCEEAAPPYWRPPLSKSILQGTEAPETAQLRPDAFWARRGITLELGVAADRLCREDKLLVTQEGASLPYTHAVLATGADCVTPRLPGITLAGVHALRGLRDALALRDAVMPGTRIAILGGGFIGLEAAAALTARGGVVTVIEREARVLARVAAPALSAEVLALHAAQGVEFRLRRSATRIGGATCAEYVELDDGALIPCEVVLVCVGVKPRTQLAEAAGLPCQDGIMVDQSARSSDPAVLALGDCARFPSARYGRMLRLESIQNAIDGAAVVAASIRGEQPDYDPVPMISSLQFGHQLDFIGLADAEAETEVVQAPHGGGFLVLHHKQGALWAVEGMDLAAGLLKTLRTAVENRVPARQAVLG